MKKTSMIVKVVIFTGIAQMSGAPERYVPDESDTQGE
jgi:hypothetical protein